MRAKSKQTGAYKFSLISMKLLTYTLSNLPLIDGGKKKSANLSYLNTLEITAICRHVCTNPDSVHVIFTHP